MSTKSTWFLSNVLTRDYTPWANRYVYWLKTPFGALSAAAFCGLLIGWFVTPQGYAIVGAIVGVLAIGVVWPWIGLRGIACQLGFSQARCEEGTNVTVEVEIVNRWPFPVWGLAIERGFFVSDAQGNSAVVSLARIPGWSTCRFTFPFQPELRGAYPEISPQITTEFPFGLWKALRPCNVSQKLLVWPRFYPLASLPLPAGAAQHLFSPSDQRSGDEGERIGARPYRQGDSLRNVHWAQTARCDRMIVCERQGAAQTNVCIVIDCQAASHRGQGADATIEWALRIGGSVAVALFQQNVRVSLEIENQNFALDANPASWRKMQDAMARFALSNPVRLPSRRRNGVVIVVRTNLSEPLCGESRAIVLNVATNESEKSDAHQRMASPWIGIDSLPAAAAELQNGWKKQRKEAWRHV
ncbi:DUF58 domain-containing protein [Blastopirellula sp. J2-11]|uniref:DUF58 domain-containing protein n=1 Tax=Blastopirellula sp. J2-11 TaxID=2943192 RepID=UPI0021C9870F|nr:DUF58 domain-containing protein [Blastopirellula sp. J2-11]UUO04543.1 DUF58 domain-containing protein [Blastopirellula sp. J2-11]